MYQQLDPRRGPWSRDERLFLIFLAVLAVGFLTADIALSFSVAKLRVVVFLVSWVPLLIARECIRRLIVGRAERMIFGMGRPLISGRIEWRPLLWSSVARPMNPQRAHRSAIAGLIIYPIVMALSLWQLPAGDYFAWSEDWTRSIWQALTAAAFLQLGIALIPHRVWSKDAPIPSDGWVIWFGTTHVNEK